MARIWHVTLVALIACGSSGRPGPVAIAVPAPPNAAAAALPPADDPQEAWHDRPPAPIGDSGLYLALSWPGFAPPRYVGTSCRLERAGALFVVCSTDTARVDGASLDLSISRSAPMTIGALEGKWPDDLWATPQTTGPLANPGIDEPSPPTPDAFREGGTSWMRYRHGSWQRLPSAGARHAYVRGSSAFLILPVPGAREVDVTKKGCADYSCGRLVPRFVTTDGAPTPDFASLRGTIAWLHDASAPTDFAVAVDPDGPTYVLLHAMDVRTRKKGFGVASWKPGKEATFTWLPAPLDAMPALRIEENIAAGGHASFLVEALAPGRRTRHLVELEGAAWRQRVVGPELTLKPMTTDAESRWDLRRSDDGALERRAPDGSWRIVEPFGKRGSSYEGIESVWREGPDDYWVVTRGALFRTVRPTESLHITEHGGRLHPWPPEAKDDCKHPFAIFDATEEQDPATFHAPPEWEAYGEPDTLEMHLFGLVIVGVTAKTVAEARARIEHGSPRAMEGTHPLVVCARPVGAKPYHHVPWHGY